jgi:hypothetical protein
MKPRVTIWGFRSEYDRQQPNQAIASHAYIHAGYFKAFKALGYDVIWHDDAPGYLPAEGEVVFCMDCRIQHVPRRPDLFYIGHNLEQRQTEGMGKRIALQYWTPDCVGAAQEGKDYVRWDGSTLYMPWASDMLPGEIGTTTCAPPNRVVYWTGSVWDDNGMGNVKEIAELRTALAKHNLELKCVRPTDATQAEFIRNSHIAPSMQGAWQIQHGYIPCRAFKNTSYGQMLITNNPIVRDLFNGYCAFGETVESMVDAAMRICCEPRATITRHAMDIVRGNHCYTHRVESMMKIVEGLL